MKIFFASEVKNIPNFDAEKTKLSQIDREEDFVTIEEASEILGLHRSQTRALLGEPDRIWESAAGRIQYIYNREHVFSIKTKRETRKTQRQSERGLRICYFCREKFHKEDLFGGLCPACQAKKLVKNFICHGDCCRNCCDKKRLELLSATILQIGKEKDPE